MKLKPFDLEAAKRGEPVVTREGKPWHFLAYQKQFVSTKCVVGYVDDEQEADAWSDNGRYFDAIDERDEARDLFMAPRRVQAWARLVRLGSGHLAVDVCLAAEGAPPDWSRPVGVYVGDAVKIGDPQDEDDE